MTELELDEILTLHWPRVIRRAYACGDKWAQRFAKSIAKNSKKTTWKPSTKQAVQMRRLVRELSGPKDEPCEVIES
ncbi:MAG: hypothetical protein ACWA40_03645 [Planktomarina sp.]